MAEEKRGTPIEKWDEVNGVTSEETVERVTEGFCDSGVGPSISRNYI